MRDFEEPGSGTVPRAPTRSPDLENRWKSLRPRLEVYLESFSGLRAEDVEDALQRTLLSLWRDGARLEGDSVPWLYAVARNAAIDAIRRNRREASRRPEGPDGRAPGVEDCASSYAGPEESVLDGERAAFIATFLAGLDDGERELMHLAYAEDFSYSRIAAITGRPLGTVKWKMAGLKRRLADSYRKEFG